MARWLAALAVLFASCGAARGQEAQRPAVAAGDLWKFVVYYSQPSAVPNREWRVVSVGDVIEATENGEPLRLTRDLGVLESPLLKDTDPRRLDFPLTVGKRWRYESDWTFKPKNSNGHHAVEVRVVGYEVVEVPAGRFEAFKLMSKARVSGTAPIGSVYDAETTTTYWYAPAARAVVRSIHRNPYLGSSTTELVEVKLK